MDGTLLFIKAHGVLVPDSRVGWLRFDFYTPEAILSSLYQEHKKLLNAALQFSTSITILYQATSPPKSP